MSSGAGLTVAYIIRLIRLMGAQTTRYSGHWADDRSEQNIIGQNGMLHGRESEWSGSPHRLAAELALRDTEVLHRIASGGLTG